VQRGRRRRSRLGHDAPVHLELEHGGASDPQFSRQQIATTGTLDQQDAAARHLREFGQR
jgi:hypothetical protein